MTKTKQASRSAKPAPVELHDEALDRATGGGEFTITFQGNLAYPGGANFQLNDGSVRLVK